MHKIWSCIHLKYLFKNNAYRYTPKHHKQHAIEVKRHEGSYCAICTDESKSLSGMGFATMSPSKTNFPCLTMFVFTAQLCANPTAQFCKRTNH